MRSVNTAKKAGRDIGRSIEDIWLPDDLIRSHVIRRIEPQIKLLRSDEDRAVEGWWAGLILSIALAVAAILVSALLFVPVEIFANVSWLTGLSNGVSQWPGVLVVVALVVSVALAVAVGVGFTSARRRAEDVHDRTVAGLCSAAADAALAVLASRRSTVGMPIEQSASYTAARPIPSPRGTDARGAEEVVAQWMRHLGANDAQVTQYTGDGGIDVVSRRCIAQVKHYAGSVGVAAIRELVGVAAADRHRRQPLFFTKTGYAAGAVVFADNAGVVLFVYDIERADLRAMNGIAKTLMVNGV